MKNLKFLYYIFAFVTLYSHHMLFLTFIKSKFISIRICPMYYHFASIFLINKCGLLMGKHDFNSAYNIYKYINDNIDSSNLFYINECKCELMFLNIIKNLNINDIYTDDLNKYINLSSMSMSKKVLMYAYYLIYKKDAGTANKIYNEASRLYKNYAPESEAKIEMELINFIKKNYENKRIGV